MVEDVILGDDTQLLHAIFVLAVVIRTETKIETVTAADAEWATLDMEETEVCVALIFFFFFNSLSLFRRLSFPRFANFDFIFSITGGYNNYNGSASYGGNYGGGQNHSNAGDPDWWADN